MFQEDVDLAGLFFEPEPEQSDSTTPVITDKSYGRGKQHCVARVLDPKSSRTKRKKTGPKRHRITKQL
jgi:hypothetical protein